MFGLGPRACRQVQHQYEGRGPPCGPGGSLASVLSRRPGFESCQWSSPLTKLNRKKKKKVFISREVELSGVVVQIFFFVRRLRQKSQHSPTEQTVVRAHGELPRHAATFLCTMMKESHLLCISILR